MRLRKVALFGEGILSKSPVVTRQRRLNCYIEVRKDGDKSSVFIFATPGLVLAFPIPTTPTYPVRGWLGTPTGLYVVVGSQFLSLSVTGAILFSGSIGTVSGPVSLANNPVQVCVVDGSAGYIFTLATQTLSTITSAGFPNGAATVAFCNGFFEAELPGTNQFFVSNFNDGTTWNALSVGFAQQYPGLISAVDQLGGLLIPMSSEHLEFWQNVGANPQPFQYIQSSAAEYGLAAIYSRVHLGDSLAFLARTREGGLQFCRVRGYQVSPISTTDIDNIVQNLGTTSDCVGLVYQQDEHKFAQWTFPTANRTLLWDSTNDKAGWSETQSGVTSAYAARHLGQFSTVAFGKTLVSDYSNGNVYTLSPTAYTDNGNTIVRELVTKTTLNDFNSFQCGAVYLDMQTGVGLSNPSAQGYAPLLMIQAARDNRDFGPERFVPIGQQGQYWTRVLARRWGRARQGLTFRFRMTDPVPFVVGSGAMLIRARNPVQRRAV